MVNQLVRSSLRLNYFWLVTANNYFDIDNDIQDDAEVGAKIPLPPSIPPGEKHFIVPSGIRPELQKTRIEV